MYNAFESISFQKGTELFVIIYFHIDVFFSDQSFTMFLLFLVTGETVVASSPNSERFVSAREYFAEADTRERLTSDYFSGSDTPSKLRVRNIFMTPCVNCCFCICKLKVSEMKISSIMTSKKCIDLTITDVTSDVFYIPFVSDDN